MRKFLKGFAVVLLSLAAVATLAWATADISATMGDGDIYEINNATPGLRKVSLGTRLRGLLVKASTAIANTTHNTTVATADITASFVIVTPSAWGQGLTLGNGYDGQLVTFVLTTDGGKDMVITPTTKTGYSTITLNDANDSITLRYVNSTVGWVVAGNSGATVA